MAWLLLLLGLIRWALGVPHVVIEASDSGGGGLVDWLVAIGTIGTAVSALVALRFNAVTNRRDVEERRRHQISRLALWELQGPVAHKAGAVQMSGTASPHIYCAEGVDCEVSINGARTYPHGCIEYKVIVKNASDAFFYEVILSAELATYFDSEVVVEPLSEQLRPLEPGAELVLFLAFNLTELGGRHSLRMQLEATDSLGIRWSKGTSALAKQVR